MDILFSLVEKPFKTLKVGNVNGQVYRLFAEKPVPVYQMPVPGARVMKWIKPGSLLVGFHDPGEMRQVNTPDEVFGYITRSVTLLPVEGLNPEALYDPVRLAAAESALPALEEMAQAYAIQRIRNNRSQYLYTIGAVVVLVILIIAVYAPRWRAN
jgi:hypothetical protein